MNATIVNGKGNGGARHESFFLTEVLDAPVTVKGRKLGTLKDVVAVDRERMAEVTHVQIGRPFGNASLLVPLTNIRVLKPHEVVLEIENIESYVRQPTPEEVLLRDYLLDKKVLDVEEREVEVVYDMRLVVTGEKVYVTDVDISRYGLLRRLGLKGLAKYFYQRAEETKKRMIPWSYVEPLPAELGALKGNVKLSVLKETLADIHPADLADILEELDSGQRVTLLEGLDTEHASDTLEEIDPAVQRDIVFSLRKERVAQLIREMTPGQAADIMSVLPAAEKRKILKLLGAAQVGRIKEIMEKEEVSIRDFAISRFFKFPPETTVGESKSQFRLLGPSMEMVMYFYIVNGDNKLLGVISIEDVFMADDDAMLKDLMVENVITLKPESTIKEATEMFTRYLFKALPIADENDMLLGVAPYRDVMNLKHRMLE